MTRLPLAAVLLVTLFPAAAPAAPRDDALRVAPPDAAVTIVLQNARGHLRDLAESPFAAWFPTSTLGKQLLGGVDLKALRQAGGAVFTGLGTNPEELLDDVLGDAVVFAFTPAGEGREERAVLLIRPRKPETLEKLLDRLNSLQEKSGELKGVGRKEHSGSAYTERRKAGGSEFYAFAGGVFAFSSSEADIRGVIDRQKAAAEKPPELAARLDSLGVSDAALVVLVNPRRLDAELAAKVAAARPDEKPALTRFAEVWKALDAAALYLALGRDLEAGVSLRFRPGDLPPALRGVLAGPRTPSGLWAAVPDDAIFAAAGRFRAAELFDGVASLLPADGKGSLKTALDQTLGPVVGRDKLPLVLDALGPDWGIWAAPPKAGAGFTPVVVAAVQVRADGEKGKAAARAMADAVDYGFRTARVAYNASHPDQIDLREERDGDVVVTSLVNDAAFPAGFRPSFALKGGYLLVATSPDAIKGFTPPAAPRPGGEVPVARFSGARLREYLRTHRAEVAKFLASTGAGKEPELLAEIDQIAGVLEPLDRIELIVNGNENGVKLALRVTPAKPLKK